MVSSSLISTLFASVLLAASSLVNAQNVISVDGPQPGANIMSKKPVSITYTVIGSQAGTDTINVIIFTGSTLLTGFFYHDSKS